MLDDPRYRGIPAREAMLVELDADLPRYRPVDRHEHIVLRTFDVEFQHVPLFDVERRHERGKRDRIHQRIACVRCVRQVTRLPVVRHPQTHPWRIASAYERGAREARPERKIECVDRRLDVRRGVEEHDGMAALRQLEAEAEAETSRVEHRELRKQVRTYAALRDDPHGHAFTRIMFSFVRAWTR